MKPILLELCNMSANPADSTFHYIHYYLTRTGIPHTLISDANIVDTVKHLQTALEMETNVILCKHGLFEHLSQLRYYFLEHHISKEDYFLFSNVYLDSIFSQFNNYVLLLNNTSFAILSPQYSLARQECAKLYKTHFQKVEFLDIDDLSPKASTAAAISLIADFLENEVPCTISR